MTSRPERVARSQDHLITEGSGPPWSADKRAIDTCKGAMTWAPIDAGEIVKAYKRAMRAREQSAAHHRASESQFPPLPTSAGSKLTTDFRAMYMALCVKYNELRGTYKALVEAAPPNTTDADVIDALQSLRCAANDMRHQLATLRAHGPSAKAMNHAVQSEAHLAECKAILRATIRGLRDGDGAAVSAREDHRGSPLEVLRGAEVGYAS